MRYLAGKVRDSDRSEQRYGGELVTRPVQVNLRRYRDAKPTFIQHVRLANLCDKLSQLPRNHKRRDPSLVEQTCNITRTYQLIGDR